MNSSTDYAIRIIIYLAKQERVISSQLLSRVIDVSPRYLLQIGAKLRDSGLVSVMHGSSGGYILLKKPNAISLHDIMQIMEGDSSSHQWTKHSNEKLNEFLVLNDVYQNIDRLIEQGLKNITIERILAQANDEREKKRV